MRNIIVGTAGHIDHGKTALVKALTGIDTDRLAEERRRGISIDLGFAHMSLAEDLRIGFVDVPGHERFVKNMLAGAGGIDLVLLIIAADESIKPQTREHFDICRLLGISRGLIVLTKSDLVDRDILDLVRLEAEELVRGSFLEGAPVVAVSSSTGHGLDELKGHLERITRAAPPKDSSRHFRLPIDRSFSMRGFGAVVTGTLIAGSVSVEQEVEAHPGGLRLRVRGIQVHGSASERAVAGQRTALNLAGADASGLARGMVLSEPGRFRPTQAVDSLFDLLPSAKPLKHRAPVHFHAGTAEVEAEARLLESNEALEAGQRAFVRFLLRDPVLLLPGDRFIARMFSPVVTIGGGAVLDIAPPVRLRRAAAAARLKTLAGGSATDRIALLVRETRYGIGVEELVARSGQRSEDIEEIASSSRLVFFREPQPWLLDPEWLRSVIERLQSVLSAFHRENPLLPGMAKEEVRSRELPGAPPFLLDAVLGKTRAIVAEGETLRLAAHSMRLKQDEEEAVARIEGAFEQAGLAVPATSEVLVRSGVEPARARSLLQMLIRNKRLVRAGGDLVFHHTAIRTLREMLASRKGESFTVPAFKDWTGISRKYAIPLLEFLDRERVTRRQGDTRIVL